jgi:hypothetical protein
MPGNNISLTLPTSSDNWPSWATKVVNALVAVQNDIAPAVGFSKLIADGDLNLANYLLNNVGQVVFTIGSSPATAPGLAFNGAELYVTDGNGRVIQLTNGGAINVSSAGGFVNEYISAGAQAKYTNGTALYEFLTAAGAAYANLKALSYAITNGANAVTLKYGGAANYNLTIPAAPAAVALVSLDNAGNVSTSANVATPVTFASANITFTGTSDLKHPNRTRYEPASALHIQDVGGAAYQYTTSGSVVNPTAAGSHYFRIPGLRANERLQNVRINANKVDALATAVTLRKWVSNVPTIIASSTLPAAIGTQVLTLNVGVPVSPATSEIYVLEVAWTTNVGNRVYDIGWTIDNG